MCFVIFFFFFQAEDGIRDAQESRGLGDVYKRQSLHSLLAMTILMSRAASSPSTLTACATTSDAWGRKEEVVAEDGRLHGGVVVVVWVGCIVVGKGLLKEYIIALITVPPVLCVDTVSYTHLKKNTRRTAILEM
eukprot:TRINITY_DN40203_c0_g1_i1.p1 TRINITY_DN40203_c0_g1~~TRINITY_DN40203_c0_g1_i1.p1  ORF type:complete len:134 (-),score=23.90 TRINITY_DN40203_c0_g1_i1:35-436(-)